MTLPAPGGRPKDRVLTACELFGRDRIVAWCEALLSGSAGDDDPAWPDISWLGGTIGWPATWRRVWGARGLLHIGPPAHPEIVLDALADDAWRVREMALKVIASHGIDDPRGAVETCTSDPYERVRYQAWRVLGHPDPGAASR